LSITEFTVNKILTFAKQEAAITIKKSRSHQEQKRQYNRANREHHREWQKNYLKTPKGRNVNLVSRSTHCQKKNEPHGTVQSV